MHVQVTHNTQSFCVIQNIISHASPHANGMFNQRNKMGISKILENHYTHTLKINKHSTKLTQAWQEIKRRGSFRIRAVKGGYSERSEHTSPQVRQRKVTKLGSCELNQACKTFHHEILMSLR